MTIYHRPIIPGVLPMSFTWYGRIYGGGKWWGDGSKLVIATGKYTWPDGTTGHDNPKNTTTTFGSNQLTGFQWGVNLFPFVYYSTSGSVKLTDKDSTILTSADFNVSAGYKLNSLIYGVNIQDFCSIQVTGLYSMILGVYIGKIYAI